MDMIFTIGIFTSLFFSILLLRKKNKSLPDKILSLWMLVISIHLGNYYIYSNGYWDLYPHLIGITVPIPLFYGPLLFLYIFYSIYNERKLRKRDYLHFSPILLTYIYMFDFFFFYSGEEKRMVDKGLINDFDVFSNIMAGAYVVSAIIYTIYAFVLLKKHKKLIEQNFSNTENINLNWLKSFIYSIGLIAVTVAIILITRDALEIEYPFNPDFIFYSMLVFAILSLGYFGIRHENVFTDNIIVDIEDNSKTSYKSSSLKDDLASEKHNALLRMMSEEKPYLEPNLTLNILAERLNISLHHLSQIINQFEGQNFNDFVNKYRVEEFLERAKRDKHYSFLALALDSGFNSKSTFNAVFRKHKGVTPSQHLADLASNNT